jgi:hypothetical protein
MMKTYYSQAEKRMIMARARAKLKQMQQPRRRRYEEKLIAVFKTRYGRTPTIKEYEAWCRTQDGREVIRKIVNPKSPSYW